MILTLNLHVKKRLSVVQFCCIVSQTYLQNINSKKARERCDKKMKDPWEETKFAFLGSLFSEQNCLKQDKYFLRRTHPEIFT